MDKILRKVERDAANGDPDAKEKLMQLQRRAGKRFKLKDASILDTLAAAAESCPVSHQAPGAP